MRLPNGQRIGKCYLTSINVGLFSFVKKNNLVVSNFKYSMNGQFLEKSESEKDLGVLISNDLKWDKHISKITNKANSILAMIRNSFQCLDTSRWLDHYIFP